jgi:transposase
MAMGKRRRGRQRDLWVEAQELAKSPGHPFYQRLGQILEENSFDRFAEEQCQKFYAETKGRPSLAPGVYFRVLLIGYFEGIDSERGIAWRLADSLTLREFLGYKMTDSTPVHSTISRTRQRIDVETHELVFGWFLQILAKAGLVKGKTIGVDATTLEANAALRSIVRRDSGESYEEFLIRLAKASGIETPTREDLARLDRKRQKKGSNDDWTNPNDPDAKITKMKDGRTRLAHKAEHAIDMDSGAILAATVQPADRGDCQSLGETLDELTLVFEDILADSEAAEALDEDLFSELVTDKGYHSNATLLYAQQAELRTYVSEPKRGRRNWKGKQEAKEAVYGNRRRIRGSRGRRLLRKRGELLERPNAHCYDAGGMRRVHLRGHENIRKRLLIHLGGFNLGLLMRALFGAGTPRGLRALVSALNSLVQHLQQALQALRMPRTLLPTTIRSVINFSFPIRARLQISVPAA